jgi:nucleoside 2-deoxyribosyltransferase
MKNKNAKRYFIVHSKGLTDRACDLAEKLRREGHEVYVPGIQTKQDTDELTIARANREAISSADEVRVIWDGTSHGVIFDLGMAFAMHKPIKLEYMIPKSMKGLMERLSEQQRRP